MAMTEDFTAKIKEMMDGYPMDTAKLEEAFKASAAYGEKASAIALDAAGKSTDISVGFTMETLGRIGDLAKARPEPMDYAQALSDFASAQMSSISDNMIALGEVARTAQGETMELMMSLGQDMADDASAATSAAAEATTSAATQAASTAKTATRRSAGAAKKAAAPATETPEAPLPPTVG